MGFERVTRLSEMTQPDYREIGLALASEAGLTDADYIEERSDWLDAGFIGGMNADEETQEAGRKMIERDRKEFVYQDPCDFLRREFSSLDPINVVKGANVRSSSLEGLLDLCSVIREFDGVLEINAHCRQQEMIDVGCGHALMRELDRLKRWIESVKEKGVAVSVKTRARVVDDVELARAVERAGADMIHVDCMDYPEVVNEVTEETDLFVIANNGVRTREDVLDYIERGADAVSTARGARRLKDLKRIERGVRSVKKKEA